MILNFRARHFTARHFKALSGGIAVSEVALLANDVESASSVTQPLLGVISLGSLFAEDVQSASSVGQPALQQVHGLLANDVQSASSVTTPALAEIAPGVDALLANDVTSASSVSTPALVVIGGEVLPPVLGGAARPYGRYFTRKRWEELLRELERERRQAEGRAEAFRGKKDRAKARKAAGEASEAIARAWQAAEEAQAIAHAGDITRMLEGAARATSLAAYLRQMEMVRLAAIEMELEDDDETVLMMVA